MRVKIIALLWSAGVLLQAFETPIGEFQTHVEFYYYDINTLGSNHENDAHATAVGGFIAYRSIPLFEHFHLGYTHYLSYQLLDGKNPERTSLVGSAGKDISPLVELYVDYSDKSWEMKLGKQRLDTPLINDDTTRLIPFSYEAINMHYRFDEQSLLTAGYVWRFRPICSEEYTRMTPSGYAEDGVGYLGFNTEFGDVQHQWYYYHAPQLYDALHMQVESKTPYDTSKDIIYGVQAIYTFANGEGNNIENHANGGDDVQLLAAKLGLESSGFAWIASLSYNFGEDGISRGYGGLSSLYTSSMITTGKSQGNPFAKSIKLRYTYDSASKKDAYTSALYLTNVTYSDPTLKDINAIYIDHKFRFRPREYLHLRFERQFIAGEADRSYFRIISAYEF